MNSILNIRLNIYLKLLMLILALEASSVMGQAHDDTGQHGHDFKKFRVALNLAQAFMPTASIEESTFVIIPVWGLDLQFWFNEHWGVALKNDIEIAKYTLPESGESGEVQLRENPIIMSLPVYYSPWEGGLTFFAGPGIELDDHGNFYVVRLGIGYEFHLPGHWDVAPEVVYDLKDGHINSFTIAIGFGKRF